MNQPQPKDKKLYESVKRRVYAEMPKHSAYRSGKLVQEYKKAYQRKYGSGEAYSGRKSGSDLKRWFKEDWRTQSGSKTYQKKGDVFRPTKRVSKETPTTFGELSRRQIRKAQLEKKRSGRVRKFDD